MSETLFEDFSVILCQICKKEFFMNLRSIYSQYKAYSELLSHVTNLHPNAKSYIAKLKREVELYEQMYKEEKKFFNE